MSYDAVARGDRGGQRDVTYVPTPVEEERRNRIRVSVAAYAYEFLSDSVMSDAEFDALCLRINPQMATGNRKLDAFFRQHFNPATGMWIRQHPDKAGLHRLYLAHYKDR